MPPHHHGMVLGKPLNPLNLSAFPCELGVAVMPWLGEGVGLNEQVLLTPGRCDTNASYYDYYLLAKNRKAT